MKQFIYAPDAEDGGSASDEKLKASKTNNLGDGNTNTSKSKPNIPNSNIDLAYTAVEVATYWKSKPFFKLLYVTQSEFETRANDFQLNVQKRKSAGGKVSPFRDTLEQMDDEMDDAWPFVRTYLFNKYKSPRDVSFYPSFGLVHDASGYHYPTNRQGRLSSLKLTVEAIADNGFDDFEFGKTFWTNLLTNYDVALKASGKSRGGVSDAVKLVNSERIFIRKVLKSILQLIEANYPDNNEYIQVRRVWGFQKERN